jgi:hypothetical protein
LLDFNVRLVSLSETSALHLSQFQLSRNSLVPGPRVPIMKYYMKTGITEFGITGVGTRDAGTSEFSNLKTETLEFGITGGFPSETML